MIFCILLYIYIYGLTKSPEVGKLGEIKKMLTNKPKSKKESAQMALFGLSRSHSSSNIGAAEQFSQDSRINHSNVGATNQIGQDS
jgi:hypothetical protein